MSEFEHEPRRISHDLDEGRVRSMAGVVFDLAEVVVDSIKNGFVGAVHVSATMIHISADVLRLDREN